jgi:hypothetical protein
MHPEILTEDQRQLLPLVRVFSDEYYLVGGTAIALLLGHRRSVDFDLFNHNPIKRKSIKHIIENYNYPTSDVLFEDSEQLHIIIKNIKLTFYHYPHIIDTPLVFEDIVKLPELLTLAAMKAYALGGRGKWKDYIDLFFLLKHHFTLREISDRSKQLFGHFFNEKLFREQLSFFDDIDYRETVEYVGENRVDDEEIKKYLVTAATEPF